jgi:carbamoyltransferase
MITWGISALSHDAALAVVKDKQLVFASHSERYSRIKNDKHLHTQLLFEALAYGSPDSICYYEQPLLKLTRQIYAKQWPTVNRLIRGACNGRLLADHITHDLGVQFKPDLRQHNVSHHLSHAAGGYFTSPFREATVVVIDAIGEWEVLTIWEANGNKLKKIYSQRFPHSIGLFYSAMTQRCGFKPNEEEYILMGMSAFGDPNKFYKEIKDTFIASIDGPTVHFLNNLHRGCGWWKPEGLRAMDIYDVAAATQKIYEEMLVSIMTWARDNCDSKNLVFTGGCALNCVANSIIAPLWDDIWIMPSPGDAGSAIGAVLANKKTHIRWPGAFLGHEIHGAYPTDKVIEHLLKKKICGVANGKAEFGPRAFGHRSLLADPRGGKIKELVNKYKQREPFRPFAPMILAEHAADYFDMPVSSSPYMQFTAKCKYPKRFPAIIHEDNTSRVQTVSHKDCPHVRKLLETWFKKTGCPMLLNTSLNIKGEPLVNSKKDAKDFEKKHKIKVYTQA